MASLSWPSVGGTAINTSMGTLAGVGSGAYTIVALTNPQFADGGLIAFKVTSSPDIEIIGDTSAWFGANDFTSGYTGHYTVGDWQIIGQSKANGTNVYRWHWWNYTTNSAKDHADGTGTHANPGAITAITIGDADVRGRGFIAAIAVWKRVLSDAEFNSLCTTNLSDWMAVSGGAPDAIWALNVAAASVVDGTGNGANESSVSGTISLTGTDPPSFNYALTSAVVAPPQQRLPPLPLLQQLMTNAEALRHQGGAMAVDATVSPSTVAATATVPAVSVFTGEVVIAGTVAAVATVGAPTVQTGEAVTAVTVAAVATVGTVSVTTSGNVSINATTVAAVATVGAPTVQTGETVTAVKVSATATVGAPTLQTGQTATAVIVAAVATVGAPAVNTGEGVAATTVAAVATVGAVTVRLSVAIAPGTVAVTATVGAPALSAGQVVAAVLVAAAATVGVVSVSVAAPVGLVGNVHGPLPIAPGQIVVHTGTIAGAVT